MEVPSGISVDSWYDARHMLSNGFTTPISLPVDEVVNFAHNLDYLRSYEYTLATMEEFRRSADVPAGIPERITNRLGCDKETAFVVYDPMDDKDGFLLLGDNPIDLAKDTCEYILNGEPPLGLWIRR